MAMTLTSFSDLRSRRAGRSRQRMRPQGQTVTVLAAIFAAGAALAVVGEGAPPAYGAPADMVSRSEVASHAAATFRRADLDGSGRLDSAEFTALSLVSAELAAFNGFVVIAPKPGEAKTLGLGDVVEMSGGEPPARDVRGTGRTRIEAVALRDFRSAMDVGDGLSFEGYLAYELARFDAADANGDERLLRGELADYARSIARVEPGASV